MPAAPTPWKQDLDAFFEKRPDVPQELIETALRIEGYNVDINVIINQVNAQITQHPELNLRPVQKPSADNRNPMIAIVADKKWPGEKE